jgi:hypothetical protein
LAAHVGFETQAAAIVHRPTGELAA